MESYGKTIAKKKLACVCLPFKGDTEAEVIQWWLKNMISKICDTGGLRVSMSIQTNPVLAVVRNVCLYSIIFCLFICLLLWSVHIGDMTWRPSERIGYRHPVENKNSQIDHQGSSMTEAFRPLYGVWGGLPRPVKCWISDTMEPVAVCLFYLPLVTQKQSVSTLSLLRITHQHMTRVLGAVG